MRTAERTRSRRGVLPLTGRDAELAVIDEVLDDLTSGERGGARVVTVLGEPGIGTSRLLDEACRRAHERGVRIVSAAGWSADAPGPIGATALSPHWPWGHLLDQLAPGAGSPDAGGSGWRRLDDVASAIVAAARSRPLVVAIDDVHLLGPDALTVTRFAIRAARGVPVAFVLGSHEPADESGREAIDDIARDGVRLPLAPLEPAVIGELLRRRLDGSDAPPADAVDADELYLLTGGNPLLIDEILHGGSASMAGAPAGASIRSVVERRLAQLDGAHHRVLVAAAIMGPDAEPAALARACAMAERDVDAAIAGGVRVGLLAGGRQGRLDRRPGRAATASTEGLAVRWFHPSYADVLASRCDELGQRGVDLRRAVADELERPGGTVGRRLAGAEQRLLVAASTGSPDDLGAAARAAVDTARVMRADHAHRAAADLLGRAADLFGGDALDDGGGAERAAPVELVLAAADAALGAGDLRAARRWARAVQRRARHVEERAEAVLGLGGIWVHEHRSTIDRERYLGALDRCIAELDAGSPLPTERRGVLLARATVRRAAEHVYVGRADRAAVERAVDACRRTGDDAAVVEALSLLHHCSLAPAHAVERLAVADEMIRLATALGSDLWSLLGVMWRAVDLLLLGDRRAERAMRELDDRAAVAEVGAVDFVVATMRVLRLIRRGALAEAEAAAHVTRELGMRIGDADALAYHGAQLMVIRWLQGRSAEVLPLARDVASSPTVVDGASVFDAAVAALAADAGALDESRAAAARVRSGALESPGVSSTWPLVMFGLAEAADACADAETGRTVAAALAPFADRPLVPSLGVVCLGSAERTLGIAARAAGDLDGAIVHLRRAVAASARLGNAPMEAMAVADLGETLLRRGAAGSTADRVEAVELLELAARSFAGMDLDERSERARSLAAAHRVAPQPRAGVVRRVGHQIELAWGGAVVVLDDSVGLRRLVTLLRSPGRDVRATELAAPGLGPTPMVTGQVVLDVAALDRLRRRIADLRAEIDDARVAADVARAEVLHRELDALLDEVRRHTGLGGRARSFADADERARIAVQKSIRRLLDRIVAVEPARGAALARCVHTGARCRFDPAGDVPAEWTVDRSIGSSGVGGDGRSVP